MKITYQKGSLEQNGWNDNWQFAWTTHTCNDISEIPLNEIVRILSVEDECVSDSFKPHKIK